MYGLPHAGIIAQKLLEERLAKHGYHQSKTTPGFWTHEWRPICFSLIVDDFGVKYVGKEHAMHLLNALKEHYEVTDDWTTNQKYVGISLDWDYDNRKVHLSMPGYCKEALTRFGHKLKKVRDQPHCHEIPVYGATVQYAKQEDTSPKLDNEPKKFVQQVTGTFLYYTRSVDPTMLMALSSIASEQANPTQQTLDKTLFFLDYVASHPDTVLTYKASDMVLHVHSDASYLSEAQARSCAAAIYFLGNVFPNPDKPSMPLSNGVIHVLSKIMKNVIFSSK